MTSPEFIEMLNTRLAQDTIGTGKKITASVWKRDPDAGGQAPEGFFAEIMLNDKRIGEAYSKEQDPDLIWKALGNTLLRFA